MIADGRGSEAPTSKEHRNIDSTALNSGSDHEDDHSQVDGHFAANAIGNWSIHKRAEPRS